MSHFIALIFIRLSLSLSPKSTGQGCAVASGTCSRRWSSRAGRAVTAKLYCLTSANIGCELKKVPFWELLAE
ncbi:hypothetical protein [Arthrobacter sp. SLBN-112]|uniref:hypothetical protein n=1 Tax=Arthrobacter sp. SLBN-112 TaxID=2768452 RepID=UPI0027B64E8A|nr:hypothetical protein [Arthrobacter sp. SLBN-112]MDQ0800563.1 hypothetical protein [Arthrobacter sp. SLBN-112]